MVHHYLPFLLSIGLASVVPLLWLGRQYGTIWLYRLSVRPRCRQGSFAVRILRSRNLHPLAESQVQLRCAANSQRHVERKCRIIHKSCGMIGICTNYAYGFIMRLVWCASRKAKQKFDEQEFPRITDPCSGPRAMFKKMNLQICLLPLVPKLWRNLCGFYFVRR